MTWKCNRRRGVEVGGGQVSISITGRRERRLDQEADY